MTSSTPTAHDVYITAHIMAMSLIDRIHDLLQDMPTHELDPEKINWSHVGSLGYVNEKLHEVVRFLGKENG